MSETTAMPPDEAATTLASIRSTRERTRGDLQRYWFAAVVFGVLTLLSTPFFSIWGGAAVGLFWLVAAPPACSRSSATPVRTISAPA